MDNCQAFIAMCKYHLQLCGQDKFTYLISSSFSARGMLDGARNAYGLLRAGIKTLNIDRLNNIRFVYNFVAVLRIQLDY